MSEVKTGSTTKEEINYIVQEGAINVTIPLDQIEDIKTVSDFFKKIPQLRRGV